MKNKTFLGLLKYAEGLANMTQKISSISTTGGVKKLTFNANLDFGGATSIKILVNGKTAMITLPNANYRNQWETTDNLTTAEVGKSIQRYTPISAVAPEDIPNYGQVMGAITTAVSSNAPIIGFVSSQANPANQFSVAAKNGYAIVSIHTFVGKTISGGLQWLNVESDIMLNPNRTSATIYVNCPTGMQLMTLMTLTQII